MPWVDPSTRATDELVTAANWNELVNNFLYLQEVNYTGFTADVSVTATTVGTANQIVTSGSITYEAVPHWIEFSVPYYVPPAQTTFVILRDGSTVVGTLLRVVASQDGPLQRRVRLTPTAAAHTYNIAAWLSGAGTGTMHAGSGGTAGDSTTDLAGHIAIYRQPT